MSWAFNVAYTNLFCITRPIGNDTPSVRHFMVGLYPLHFVVNMTALVFERYFSGTDVITIHGQIFNYNNIVLVAILTGLANLVFFIHFYYPNFFFVVLRSTAKKMYGGMTKTSMEKRRTYKVAKANGRIKEQVKRKSKEEKLTLINSLSRTRFKRETLLDDVCTVTRPRSFSKYRLPNYVMNYFVSDKDIK